MGFQNLQSYISLFFLRGQGHILLILIYVDDIIVTGFNPHLIQHIINNLQSTFALKDLGELSYFFGIHVTKNSAFFIVQVHC